MDQQIKAEGLKRLDADNRQKQREDRDRHVREREREQERQQVLQGQPSKSSHHTEQTDPALVLGLI